MNCIRVAVLVCVCWELPERQEAGFEQDGSQSPLDLLVINQFNGFQARVVAGETETRVQHLVHPGRLEALIPELKKAGRLMIDGQLFFS